MEAQSGDVLFDTPKPPRLIKRILQIGTAADEGDNVVDFFAGSASTAEAVIQLNSERAGNTKFILVQLNEAISGGQLNSIAELAKERMRRVGKQVVQNAGLHNRNLDTGFRVLKVDTSNMKNVYYSPGKLKKEVLFEQFENVKPDRTAEDLLFQVLLDWGVDLSLPIAQETIDNRTIYFVDSNALAACFDLEINEELVKKVAARKPLRVVFRDAGFSSDAVKINVEQIFKLLSPGTEVKTI